MLGFLMEIGTMAAKRLKWTNLLHLTELQFEPDEPKQLTVSDELIMTISWLTAATKHDRKLLRCDDNGALLTTNPWSLLVAVENNVLNFSYQSPDTYTRTLENKGVLCAVGDKLTKLDFVRVEDGAAETFYIPANWLYFYPHPTYSVTAEVIAGVAGASIMAITALG